MSFPSFGEKRYMPMVNYPVQHNADDAILAMLEAILMLVRCSSGNVNKVYNAVSQLSKIELTPEQVQALITEISTALSSEGLLTKDHFDSSLGVNDTTSVNLPNVSNLIGNTAELTNIDNSKTLTNALNTLLSIVGKSSDYNAIGSAGNIAQALANIYLKIGGTGGGGGGTVEFDQTNLMKAFYALAIGQSLSDDSQTWDNVINNIISNGNIAQVLSKLGEIADMTPVWKAMYYLINGKGKDDDTYTQDDVLTYDGEGKPSLKYIADSVNTLGTKIDTSQETITTSIDAAKTSIIGSLEQTISGLLDKSLPIDYNVIVSDKNMSIYIGEQSSGKTANMYIIPPFSTEQLIETTDNEYIAKFITVVDNKFVYNNMVQSLEPCSVVINGTTYEKPTHDENNLPTTSTYAYRLGQLENVFVCGPAS